MKVSLKWLKEYVDLENITPEEIANKLTFAGIEVEEYSYLARGTNLVIGQIIDCKNHPDSDHLHVLKVDLGMKYGVEQIVCGAPNARKGLKVIVARVGAKLPEVTIQVGNIRGVESRGMCCSLSELGVDKKYLSDYQLAGIEELPEDAPVGEENVLGYLGLDDVVFDLKLLANRSDCNAMMNVAKEVACLFDRTLTLPKPEYHINLQPTSFKVGSTTDKCPQFSIKVIRGIQVKESPRYLKEALMAEGVRSINNLVDIGNYIMLMTGQPLHMYDLDLLEKQELIVRDDYEGPFVALDEKTYDVLKGDLVVTSNGKPMCLAGVMGALSCAVTENTKNVAIEVANFSSAQVRRTSIRLNLGSESSARFIKGINPHQADDVLAYAVNMVISLCGCTIEEETATYDTVNHEPTTIHTSAYLINHRLGTDFKEEEIIDVLSRVGVEIEKEENGLKAIVPSHRIDITGNADLSEEVIRILGFEHVKSELPTLQTALGGLKENQMKKRKIRYFLLDRGLDEILTYTLVSKKENEMFHIFKEEDAYTLLHPMTDDHAEVRKSLLPSLLTTMQYNVARKAKRLAFFEVSEVYTKASTHTHLAIGLYGSDAYQGELQTMPYDFYHMKGIVEGILELLGIEKTRYRIERYKEAKENGFHPGRSAALYIGKDFVGAFGELHPTLKKAYDLDKAPCLMLELLLDVLLEVKTSQKKMVAPSKFPFVERDLALIVKKDIPVSDMIKTMKQAGKALVKDVIVFDVYQGEHIDFGYKSVAVKVIYQNDERTLEEKEIVAAEMAIKEALLKQHGIVLRG